MIPIAPKDATVICVDDDDDNLAIIVDLVTFDVSVKQCYGALSGEALFQLIESIPHTQVDLILLDIRMPRVDGYMVIQRIRSTPALSTTWVVAVTSNNSLQDAVEAQAAGFDGFIGKPIAADRFPEQIQRVLAGEAIWEPS